MTSLKNPTGTDMEMQVFTRMNTLVLQQVSHVVCLIVTTQVGIGFVA